MTPQELGEHISAGAANAALSALYTNAARSTALAQARERALAVVQDFLAHFGEDEDAQNAQTPQGAALLSAPGRTELGGNHTDHQHGRVLCASVNLDMLACAAPNNTSVVRVVSAGYEPVEISLNELTPQPEEVGSSAALVRGVAARIQELGFELQGFNATLTSNVLAGSGLSSSAAYEVLMGTIFNHLCCGNALDALAIAQAGQFAENVYFGKPCGLMDQMGSALGGAVAIDFADAAHPLVTPLTYNFDECGYELCLVDTGSSHADLGGAYAAIPQEMQEVAAHFGATVLRQVDEEAFWDAIPKLRRACGDRAVLRAMHFFAENERAQQEAEALSHNDFAAFLALVNESGHSSDELLQNTRTCQDPTDQALELALGLGQRLLGKSGAIRVHGGGFAGTIQAFVPAASLELFQGGMERVFGRGSCHRLRIRPQGGCVVYP